MVGAMNFLLVEVKGLKKAENIRHNFLHFMEIEEASAIDYKAIVTGSSLLAQKDGGFLSSLSCLKRQHRNKHK